VGDRFELSHTFRATSPQRRGVEALPPLDVTVPVTPGIAYLLAVRHEASGAISFHAPKPAPPRRGVEPLPETLTFEVEFTDTPDPTTRSLLNPIKAVKGVVLKAVGKLADLAVPVIGAELEDLLWKRKNLPRAWLKVTPESLKSGNLEPADFNVIAKPSDRCLLLLHGTFSNTAGAFNGLVTTRSKTGQNFFSAVQPLYGDRIFAFNHFTASQTPEQNAIDLIAGLPKGDGMLALCGRVLYHDGR